VVRKALKIESFFRIRNEGEEELSINDGNQRMVLTHHKGHQSTQYTQNNPKPDKIVMTSLFQISIANKQQIL